MQLLLRVWLAPQAMPDPKGSPHRSGRTGCVIVGVLALVLAASSPALAGPLPSPAPKEANCASDEHETVLVAPAAPSAAGAGMPQAVWLDGRRLRWPTVAAAVAGERWRLYRSARGAMRAEPGRRVEGSDASVPLHPAQGGLPSEVSLRSRHVAAGVELELSGTDATQLGDWLRDQLLLVLEDDLGRVRRATSIQHALALDAIYAKAEYEQALGASILTGRDPDAGQGRAVRTVFRLWAPTARRVALCLEAPAAGHRAPPPPSLRSMQRDARTGIWTHVSGGDLSGWRYRYIVDVVVPGAGLLRNRVTDPYSLALTADSRRSVVVALDDPTLQPPGWRTHAVPATVAAPTDMVVYELHVRDFSAGDASVPAEHRGKYLATTHADSAGMRHLRALAQAGVTDLHLLPVFDIGTIPERGCTTPDLAELARHGAASETQQALVMAGAAGDCYNWGYDPLHYTVPEGSYAVDADDPGARIVEFRRMVQALHAAGLRVGMDVVYNHTTASGRHRLSVLDRIVPGYYHRLDAAGRVERSTCCDNTATEHRMMARLMSDSVLTWAREYRIDSFRFDLMGHQPRDAMVELKARLARELGREIPLIGEGWNFGEVADGARFVQASQRSLNGTGIGTFSDRARDALRGRGGPHEQGWLNGLVYDPHPAAPPRSRDDLLRAADMARVGLAGSIRDVVLHTRDGRQLPMVQIPYGDQPAGYVSEPDEVVNYVENHDNHTLFDHHVTRLPPHVSPMDRARVQALGMATTALSQGIAYFHAGIELLRSKSMDGNSFDSGDWFNRLDWAGHDNGFGSGLPPREGNAELWPIVRSLLADASIKPGPAEIAYARNALLDVLRIRSSSTLWRMRSAQQVRERLVFHNTGPDQVATVLAWELRGQGMAGARYGRVVAFISADPARRELVVPALAGLSLQLHPVHREPGAADVRVANEAHYESSTGRFALPPRSVVVFVEDGSD